MNALIDRNDDRKTKTTTKRNKISYKGHDIIVVNIKLINNATVKECSYCYCNPI